MSDNSKIEWTEATWNPVTGCTKVSPGCDHCYAETFAERWRGVPGHYFEQGFDVALRPDKLDQPLHWKRPRRIFVNSMSDLFHDDVPNEYIASVLGVMARAPQHTFQLLTKRHGRMKSLLNNPDWAWSAQVAALAHGFNPDGVELNPQDIPWPLPNVWLGVSVEDQKWADIRIPALLETPAAVRFVSAEPLLGPVSLASTLTWPDGSVRVSAPDAGVSGIDWLIIGGESGPGARPMELDWAASLVRQCRDHEIAPFVKQLGSGLGRELGAGSKGGDWDAWPADLRVREFPQVAELSAA